MEKIHIFKARQESLIKTVDMERKKLREKIDYQQERIKFLEREIRKNKEDIKYCQEIIEKQNRQDRLLIRVRENLLKDQVHFKSETTLPIGEGNEI